MCDGIALDQTYTGRAFVAMFANGREHGGPWLDAGTRRVLRDARVAIADRLVE